MWGGYNWDESAWKKGAKPKLDFGGPTREGTFPGPLQIKLRKGSLLQGAQSASRLLLQTLLPPLSAWALQRRGGRGSRGLTWPQQLVQLLALLLSPCPALGTSLFLTCKIERLILLLPPLSFWGLSSAGQVRLSQWGCPAPWGARLLWASEELLSCKY